MTPEKRFVRDLGERRLTEMRYLAEAAAAKPNRIQTPWFDLTQQVDHSDGYGYIAIRAVDLLSLLDALIREDADS